MKLLALNEVQNYNNKSIIAVLKKGNSTMNILITENHPLYSEVIYSLQNYFQGFVTTEDLAEVIFSVFSETNNALEKNYHNKIKEKGEQLKLSFEEEDQKEKSDKEEQIKLINFENEEEQEVKKEQSQINNENILPPVKEQLKEVKNNLKKEFAPEVEIIKNELEQWKKNNPELVAQLDEAKTLLNRLLL